MKRRLLSVVLSVIVFAIIFHWLTYITSPSELPKEYYFTFYESFFFSLFFVGPVYFILGIPVSIVIDLFIAKLINYPKWLYYLYGLLSYSIAGILVGFIFLFLTFTSIKWDMDLMGFLLLCLIASNTYYHLSLLFFKLNRKKKELHWTFKRERTS